MNHHRINSERIFNYDVYSLVFKRLRSRFHPKRRSFFKIMIELLPVPLEFIEVSDETVRYPLEVEQMVDQIWLTEKAKTPHLFDGPLFAVDQLSAERISGRFISYRYFAAQLKRPELFAELKLEVLAVSGALFSPDGIVVGRREKFLSQQGNIWELVPAGGIDFQSRLERGRLDVTRQLLVELEEEVGLTAEDLTSIESCCLIRDQHNHVLDVGVKLVTERSREEILCRYDALKQAEHTELRLISLKEVATFVAETGKGFLPVSATFLRGLGLLPSTRS